MWTFKLEKSTVEPKAQLSNNCFFFCVQLLLLHKLRNFFVDVICRRVVPSGDLLVFGEELDFFTHIHE